VLTQAQISREKPIIVCNVGEFFTPLLTYLDALVDAGFVQPSARRRIQSVSRLEDVLAMLESTRLVGVI
jgi:predicted Rossmann-fold nucleotide-binding protein